MKMRMTNEAKTGLVVIVCVIGLTGLILKVGNFSIFREGYAVRSRFGFTGGVKKHAPVRLSGVDVGEVKDVRILYGDETLIELDLWLHDGVKVRGDSAAYVTTMGLMGEKYVEIRAGSASAPYVKEGDEIPGEDPVSLEELVDMGKKVAGDVGIMAQDISRLANRIGGTVADNRPKIDSIFGNLEETSDNFREFSQDIKYHPWKILIKGKEKSKEEMERERLKKLAERGETLTISQQTTLAEEPPATRTNFGPRKAP